MVKKNNTERIFNPVEDEVIEKVGKKIPEYKPPAVHRPGVDIEGFDIEVTSETLDGPLPNWDDVLKKWGFDPEIYEAIEPIKVSQWDGVLDGEVKSFFSYKGTVRKRKNIKDESYKDLVKEVKKHRKLNDKVPEGDQTFVVCLSDWQLGKDDYDGVKGTVERIVEDLDSVEERIKELRAYGRKLGTLIIAGMGDMIEGCDGHYPSQSFRVELNRREQVRIARRLVRDCICRWSKLFKDVIVIAVPGNHGENRKDGKLFTTVGDNDDVALFEQVCDILAVNEEAYGHVKFFLPEDDLSVVLDIKGTRIGFAHGHVAGSGTSPQIKIKNWWQGQSFNNTPIGGAQILVTGHFHHLSIVEYSRDKIHIQAPSQEGGSEYWEDATGERSRPGTLTFILDENGYNDIKLV